MKESCRRVERWPVGPNEHLKGEKLDVINGIDYGTGSAHRKKFHPSITGSKARQSLVCNYDRHMRFALISLRIVLRLLDQMVFKFSKSETVEFQIYVNK